MDLKRYSTFVRIAELGSLTKAAEELGCTQSAVSHSLSCLEEEMGFSLMQRSRGGVKLTEGGEKILPSIRSILTANENLSQKAAEIRGLKTGTIWIGTFTSVAVHWLPGMIKGFHDEYPEIEFRIVSGDYHDVEQWLEEGSVDLGFVGLPCEAECRYIPLMEDRILAVVPLGHRFASLPRFPLNMAGEESFITLLEGSNQDLNRAMDSVNISPKIVVQTKDDYAIIAMVENGMGVSIMPELLLKGRSDQVKLMELTPPVRRTVALAIPKKNKTGPAAEHFAEYAVKWVKEYQKKESVK